MDYDKISALLERGYYYIEQMQDTYLTGMSTKTHFRTKGIKKFSSYECCIVVDYVPQNGDTTYSFSSYFTDKKNNETHIVRDGAFAGQTMLSEDELCKEIDFLENKLCSFIKEEP